MTTAKRTIIVPAGCRLQVPDGVAIISDELVVETGATVEFVATLPAGGTGSFDAKLATVKKVTINHA